MANPRAPRAARRAALLAPAALASLLLLTLAAPARAQPGAGNAPVLKPKPVDPALQAQVQGRLIIVHRPDASDRELTEAGNLLRGGPFKADKVTRVSFGAGRNTFKASIIDSPELRRGQAGAGGLARALAPGAGGDHSDASALRTKGGVAYATPDGIASINQANTITQLSPSSWGLDRVDQVRIPLDQSYTYPAAGGDGVNVYVVDTGVYADHADFGGRATCAYSVFGPCSDGFGHGTHVAGTIGGTTWGVAKKAAIFGVQVLDASGSGSWSGVIDGINWAVNHCLSSGKKCVINMSLGGGFNAAVNDATTAAVNAGLVVAVSAGNDAGSACSPSPASTPAAITVAASTSADELAYFSNYGSCVDIVAPGMDITSAWNTGTTATNTISGTSMSSPHVAGAAALLWSLNLTQPRGAVEALITAGGNASVVALCASCAGTTQRLVYVGSNGGGPPTPPPAGAPMEVILVSGRVTLAYNRRTASVRATLRAVGANNVPLANAVLQVQWSSTSNSFQARTATVTTGSNGEANIASPSARRSAIRLQLAGASLAGYTWDAYGSFTNKDFSW